MVPPMFTAVDWIILVGYIAGTTWLADRLAKKQQTIRDFFLGGRQLSWKVVAASIVATEISGVTFVSVPAIAWAVGGNYTYLMLAVGSVTARVLIGYFFVPAYYRREIYSPYEFMGQVLGKTFDRLATVIFFLGGFLAQGARLFLAGLVLDDITGMGITLSVIALAAISVLWTWIGGITSVVWTDIIQFAILFIGALTALYAVAWVMPGGVEAIVKAGDDGGKFKLWDFTFDRTTEFTFWCGLIGTTFLTLGSHGTDQMMAQRLFCCRNAKDARKAIIASSVGVLLAAVMLSVGVGLFAYFREFPMNAADAAKVARRKDYVFPVFIRTVMPIGVKGLLFAAIFSAATATGTLAAMAQSAMATFWLPFRKTPPTDREQVFASRVLVLVAAVVLCAVAVLCQYIERYSDILRLALSMAAYTYGALLGMLLFALRPCGRDARGLIWGVGYSILLIFAINWQHHEWARYVATIGTATLFASALVNRDLLREPLRLLVIAAGAGIILLVTWWKMIDGPPGQGPEYLKLAFPWSFTIGTALTLAMAHLVGRSGRGLLEGRSERV